MCAIWKQSIGDLHYSMQSFAGRATVLFLDGQGGSNLIIKSRVGLRFRFLRGWAGAVCQN